MVTDELRQNTEMALVDTEGNIKKLRDFVLAINDNVDILITDANHRGTLTKHFASKIETEQSLKEMDDRINSIMRFHLKQATRFNNDSLLDKEIIHPNI